MEPLLLDVDWVIPSQDLSARFVRSSGPGGQNVNKVATKVELRLELQRTEALSRGQKARLTTRFPSYVTGEGQLLLTADEHRSQAMNLEAARKRLREMILQVRRPPAVRRPTKPSRAAKQRRLDEKRHRASIKSGRTSRFD
jgi:ribosome-associated protein